MWLSDQTVTAVAYQHSDLWRGELIAIFRIPPNQTAGKLQSFVTGWADNQRHRSGKPFRGKESGAAGIRSMMHILQMGIFRFPPTNNDLAMLVEPEVSAMFQQFKIPRTT